MGRDWNNQGVVHKLKITLAVAVVLSLSSLIRSGQQVEDQSLSSDRAFSGPLADRASFSTTSALPSDLFAPDFCTDPCTIPQWMLNYFQWHRNTLDSLHVSGKWHRQRLLVVRCIDDDRCGGTADRLKSLPLYLAIAAKTKRMIFLRWTRPFPLESFMLPAMELNWTVPNSLAPLLQNATSRSFFGGKALNPIVKSAHNPNVWLVEGAAQMAGVHLFRQLVQSLEPSSNETSELKPPAFFHDMFFALFQPSPNLRNVIVQQMTTLDLKPNQFVTAHIRAKYPGEPYRETWNLTLLQQTVTNAVVCASSLGSYNTHSMTSLLPVYVASDTMAALEAAQAFGSQQQQYRVTSHLDVPQDPTMASSTSSSSLSTAMVLPHRDPPHLNFAKEEDPSAFFSIFVDLFIMSQSRCVSFGAGGFGRFGSLVSFNATCRVAHSTRGRPNNCTSLDDSSFSDADG